VISEEQLHELKVAADKVDTLERTYAAREGSCKAFMYIHLELCNARKELRRLAKAVYVDNK